MVCFRYISVNTLHKGDDDDDDDKVVCTRALAHTQTHPPKPICEHEYVTVLWNQGVHADREVTANKPDIIIKNKN
jgi:hypothetical protein